MKIRNFRNTRIELTSQYITLDEINRESDRRHQRDTEEIAIASQIDLENSKNIK